MRGYEDYNYPAFHDAAEKLRVYGHDVFNPAEAFDGDQSLPVETYLRHDFENLLRCEGMCLLPGWRESAGARVEVQMARSIGLTIWEFDGGNHGGELEVTDLPVELEAALHVYGERQASYGHPATDFERTGRIWGAILGIPDVPPELVALCMAGLKISREVNAPKRDNMVDLIGYAICERRVIDAKVA
jgi:hypothetical protein